jgi:hypothetical protein
MGDDEKKWATIWENIMSRTAFQISDFRGNGPKAQKEIILKLRKQDYFVAVCEGWFDAAGATLAYMMLAAGQKL